MRMKKFSPLFFIVLRRIRTIVAAVEFSEIESAKVGIDFFSVNWGVYTIFLTRIESQDPIYALILLTQ